MLASICDAMDPRDHIYGLYGIASYSQDDELRPDYDKPGNEVYIHTTKYLMVRNNSLDLLSDAGIFRAPQFEGLPS